MKKNFISSLFCLALVLVLPLQGQGKMAFDEYVKPGHNSAKRSSHDHELIQFVEQLSILDEDESSPIHKLKDLIKRGDSVVSKDDFVAALDHAQSVIAEYNDLIPDEQIEQISNAFNALIDVVEQESDSDTRDYSSSCDDSALKIKKILAVLNKAIFCGLVAFRDEVVFCKHVEMKDSLSVRRLRAHKAKIDQLKAKKAEFDTLKAKKAKIKNLEIDEIETCDLIVDCSIYMQDSTSPAIGNIYKGGDRFLHNFGTNNTYVGEDAGNFTSTGSDNSGFGYHALLNNNESELVAVGSGALENYTTSSDPVNAPAQSVAVGYHALNANVSGTSNTAVGWMALASDVTDALTTFGDNTAVGWSALTSNTIGADNTALGNSSMNFNVIGNDNTAVGSASLQNNVSGNENTVCGGRALLSNTTGNANTVLGFRALRTNTTSNDSTAIGHRALFAANEPQLVAVGSGAMETYIASSDPVGAPAQSVAVGYHALNANVSGTSNTAVGWMALASDVTDALTTFGDNTAVGWSALTSNTIGADNTALGNSSMTFNISGNENTAVGSGSLQNNVSGNENTVCGTRALLSNTTGNANTVLGFRALRTNITGDNNTAVGHFALFNALGSNNIAVGLGAGLSYIGAESNNIEIGNAGVVGDNGIIRIGTVGTHVANFQAGIFGAGPIVGAPVLVDAVTGQLGTVASSIRYKENVQDMNAESAAILKLRPVMFNYKADAQHTKQFGLVAEEVNAVMPALVVKGADGQIETVKYHELASLLLNELIKMNARLTLLEEQVN